MQDEYANDKNMLTIGEAAKFTNLSIDTLRRWEKRGKIVAYRSPGGHRYFNKNELSNVFKKRYKRDAAKPAITHSIQKEAPIKENISADKPLDAPSLEQQPVKETEVHPVPTPPYHPSASPQLPPSTKEEKGNYSHHRQHLTPSSVLDKDRQTPPIPKKETEEVVAQPTNHADIKPPLEQHKPIAHKPATKTRHLVHSKKEGGLTKFQKFIYGAFIAFVIIDIILIILFRSWLIPLSPIP